MQLMNEEGSNQWEIPRKEGSTYDGTGSPDLKVQAPLSRQRGVFRQTSTVYNPIGRCKTMISVTASPHSTTVDLSGVENHVADGNNDAREKIQDCVSPRRIARQRLTTTLRPKC
jgi:hypothetical protein